MYPPSRRRIHSAGVVFLASFACVAAGIIVLGVAFGILPLNLWPPTPKRLAALGGGALGVAACVTVAYWWTSRPRPDPLPGRAEMTAGGGYWPY